MQDTTGRDGSQQEKSSSKPRKKWKQGLKRVLLKALEVAIMRKVGGK